MNEQDYNEMRELSWRRPLDQAEEARLQNYLAAHPEARQDWETDADLNRLIERLPAAPSVASNFTARVLQEVALENARQQRAHSSRWFIPRWNWLPRFGMVTVMLGLAGLSYHQHVVWARENLAKNVIELTRAVSASDSVALEDFEPIRRLSDPQPKADMELLALLK